MTARLTRDGTHGRVYGGDKNLVHIADGERREFGLTIAAGIEALMRQRAEERGIKTAGKLICPGCYQIAAFNALVELAKHNKQPLGELGRTMALAFMKLACDPESGVTEEIEVLLDPDEGQESPLFAAAAGLDRAVSQAEAA